MEGIRLVEVVRDDFYMIQHCQLHHRRILLLYEQDERDEQELEIESNEGTLFFQLLLLQDDDMVDEVSLTEVLDEVPEVLVIEQIDELLLLVQHNEIMVEMVQDLQLFQPDEVEVPEQLEQQVLDDKVVQVVMVQQIQFLELL